MLLHELLSLDGEGVLLSFDKYLSHRSRVKAGLLVHIAVIDARNYYLARGFESMKAFLMAKMALTEDAAYKRIQIARLARQLPRLFTAIASGELSTYDVRLLAPRLTSTNVEELVAECAHKSPTEIEGVMARRFPRAEELRLDDGISPQGIIPHDADRRSTQVVAAQPSDPIPHADRQVDLPEAIPPLANTGAPRVRTRIQQLSESRYTLQVTLARTTHDKLRRLQDLLAHAVPDRDIAEILDRSFDALMERLEKRKFGTHAKGEGKGRPRTLRAIPAQIRKAVYERDRGACAHRFEDGRICGSKSKLEYDHIVPIARGGRTTIENVRLLCRAHNQHAADQAFGQQFMDKKRASRRRFASR